MGSLETLAAFERSVRPVHRVLRGRAPSTVPPTPTPATRPGAGPRTTPPGPVELVQHHHAHVASVMAEHGVPAGRRGHRLRLRRHRLRPRRRHLGWRGAGGRLRRLPAGRPPALRAAARRGRGHPQARTGWRWPTCGRPGIAWDARPAAGRRRPPEARATVLARQLERGVQCVPTVEHGPAVRRGQLARSGCATTVSYEAQAAMELEAAADVPTATVPRRYRFGIDGGPRSTPAPVLAGHRRRPAGPAPGGRDGRRVPPGRGRADGRRWPSGVRPRRASTGGPQRRRVPERPPGPVWPGPAGPAAASTVLTHRVGPAQRRGPGPRPGRGGRPRRRRPGRTDGERTGRPRPARAEPGVAAEDLAARRLGAGPPVRAPAPPCGACRPQWPAHARHVAVEFVHPVIVGKRALPAVQRRRSRGRRPPCVCSPGRATSSWRSGRPTIRSTDDLLRRAEAWGLTSIWLGAGPPAGRRPRRPRRHGWTTPIRRRRPARAERGAPLPPAVGADPRGLRTPRPPRRRSRTCPDEVCVTCSDEGEVAEIRTVHGPRAEVLLAGRPETVDVSLVDPVAAGDLVLVHAGVALDRAGRRPAVSAEPTGFLYPFIEADERDAAGLVADLAALGPGQDGREPGPARAATLEQCRDQLDRAGVGAWPTGFAAGGRLFAFGNGGSATDAEGLVALFSDPPSRPAPAGPVPGRRPGRPHRPGQRRRLRLGLLPPAHRPRPPRRHRRSGSRPAATRANVLRAFEEASAARPADRRAVRLRGRGHGGQRRRRPLPRRARRTACTASRRPRTH